MNIQNKWKNAKNGAFEILQGAVNNRCIFFAFVVE